MKPHEIAACVKKMFTEHPEKFRQGEYFLDGGYCALGAAILCVDSKFDYYNEDSNSVQLAKSVVAFAQQYSAVNGHSVDVVNDRDGLPAILKGLEKMIEKGLENETN